MDILAALQATTRERASLRCKVGRWLDSIPEDTPGKPELVATFETTDRQDPNYRKQADLTQLIARLGNPTSMKIIGEHLRQECRCYGFSA